MEYRVSDGLVNNFCDTILRAIRCNMDIQFIGSGASAKAILYYITDYITKTQLKAHGAYVALKAAVTKLENEAEGGTEADDFTLKAKRMLVKCANALLAKQELSAPQVASYVMDYGDHYTSHLFRVLFWSNFERIACAEQSEDRAETDVGEETDGNDADAEEQNSNSEQFIFVDREP